MIKINFGEITVDMDYDDLVEALVSSNEFLYEVLGDTGDFQIDAISDFRQSEKVTIMLSQKPVTDGLPEEM